MEAVFPVRLPALAAIGIAKAAPEIAVSELRIGELIANEETRGSSECEFARFWTFAFAMTLALALVVGEFGVTASAAADCGSAELFSERAANDWAVAADCLAAFAL